MITICFLSMQSYGCLIGNVSDDYDVYREIACAVANLSQFTITFTHVKGHQNRQAPNQALSLPAQLNIECDEWAGRFIQHARRTRQYDNPALPNSYPHVCIHSTPIVRELARALWHAAQTPDYRDYLKEKFQWTDQVCDNVNWVSLKYVLQKLSPEDHTRAHKFLHDWLPLRGAKHAASPTTSLLCPQCQRETKTIWHFLECPHAERDIQYQKLQAKLNALHTRNHVDPHLFQLLWQGLQSIRCFQVASLPPVPGLHEGP